MISYLHKEDLPSRSKGSVLGRPRASNVPPVTKISGDIDDVNTATCVSIITITPSSPVATKAATISTNRSTTRLIRSTTSISSQDIRYTRYLICQSRRSTRAKR